MKQLEHIEIINEQHQKEIVVVALHLESRENLGMLLRTCEAFGVNKVKIVNEHRVQIDQKVIRISRGVTNRVEVNFCENSNQILATYRSLGYSLCCLEKCDESAPVGNVEWSNLNKVALIIGNEKHGVSQDLLDGSDIVVHIPMFGLNTSMNVIQATTIALYEMTKT